MLHDPLFSDFSSVILTSKLLISATYSHFQLNTNEKSNLQISSLSVLQQKYLKFSPTMTLCLCLEVSQSSSGQASVMSPMGGLSSSFTSFGCANTKSSSTVQSCSTEKNKIRRNRYNNLDKQKNK